MAIATPTGAGNVTTANIGSASSLTLSKPSNTADGDLLVAFVAFRNSGGTVTTPSGWTLLGPANTTNETFSAYYKAIPTASAESATTYAFSSSAGASRAAGIMFRITGANLSAISDAAGSLALYTGTASVVLPAVTAVGSYTLLLGFAVNNNATTGVPSLFTPVSLTTVGTTTGDNGTSATLTAWVGSQVLTAAGTTGTRTPTISPTASNSGGFMVTVTGIPDVVPLSSVRPDAVVSSTGWAANTGTIIAAEGDNSDSTWVESSTLTSTNVTLRVHMAPMVPALGGLNLRVRCGLDVTATTTSTAKLYDGATLVKSWSISPDSLQDFVLTATAGEVAAITTSGSPSAWRGLEVQIDSHI